MGKLGTRGFSSLGTGLSRLRTQFLVRIGSLAPVLTLAALVLFFSVVSPSFLTGANLLNIVAQVSILALVAGGMTFVVLSGEIDLSVANMATMAGIIMALAYNSDLPFLRFNVLTSTLLAILAAAGIGSATGLVVTKLGIPSFAATLAAMQISRGITLVLTQARPIYNVPESLSEIGSARVGPIPLLGLIAVGTLVLFHLILHYSRFGRYVYAVGGNRTAAKLVGIRVHQITFSCLVLSAVVSGIAGILNVGRLGSAQTFGSEDLLIDSLAAVVIGGASLFGGVGSIGGTVVGILILGVLNNGLNQMMANVFAKYLFKGLILLGALVINVLSIRLKDRAAEMAREALFVAGGSSLDAEAAPEGGASLSSTPRC